MLEYSKSGIYNNNRLPAEKKKEEKEKENTRDRSVPDGSDKKLPTHQVVTSSPGSLELFLALTDAPLTVGVARTTSKALVGLVVAFVVAAPAFLIFSVKDL